MPRVCIFFAVSFGGDASHDVCNTFLDVRITPSVGMFPVSNILTFLFASHPSLPSPFCLGFPSFCPFPTPGDPSLSNPVEMGTVGRFEPSGSGPDGRSVPPGRRQVGRVYVAWRRPGSRPIARSNRREEVHILMKKTQPQDRRSKVVAALRSASPCSFRTLSHQAQRLLGPFCGEEQLHLLLQEVVEDRMMLCSTSQGQQDVLIAKAAKIGRDLYYVPQAGKAVRLNLEDGSCSEMIEVPQSYSKLLRPELEEARTQLQASMTKYGQNFPDAVATVFQEVRTGAGLVVCVYKLKKNPKQMVCSSWKSVWNVRLGEDGRSGRLTGTVEDDVFHFEDCEIRHQCTLDYSRDLRFQNSEELVSAVHAAIVDFEDAHAAKSESLLSSTFLDMLQSLRRTLPISKQKFEWDVHCDPINK